MAEKKGRSVQYEGNSHRFADDIPSTLLCSICLGLCCDPQQAVCCGKVFCLQCVESERRLKKPKESCPCCRQPIQTFPDKRTEQEIGSLRIICGNVERGCQEQLELRDARKHKEICPLELIPCSFSDVGCSKTMLRREMKEHNKTEIVEHLDLCRKKIANFPRLEEELICNLRTKLKSLNQEVSKSKGAMPGATEDITISSCKPKGFRIEVEHFDRMFYKNIKWISPEFKVNEWHFLLHLQWGPFNINSRLITFSLQVVEGPLCYAVKGNSVHILGEIALLHTSKGVETTSVSPQIFQVDISMKPTSDTWDSTNPVVLTSSILSNTLAQQPIVICHLSFWQVKGHYKKAMKFSSQ